MTITITGNPGTPSFGDPANFNSEAQAFFDWLMQDTAGGFIYQLENISAEDYFNVQTSPTDTTAGRLPKMGNDADFDDLTATSLVLDGSTLSVEPASGDSIVRLDNAGGNSWAFIRDESQSDGLLIFGYSGNSGDIRISPNATTAVTIAAASGNVGVGTTAPSQRLHAFENVATAVGFRAQNSEGSADFQADGGQARINVGGAFRVAVSSGGTLFPADDDTQDIGSPSQRWDDIYATNGTIQTSDAKEKTDIATFSTAEKAAAKSIAKLMRTYRWKQSVAAKGVSARTHVGAIAQEVRSALEAEGLDPGQYGFFTESPITEPVEVTVTEKRQKMEKRKVVRARVEIVDGKARQIMEAIEEYFPVVAEYPLFDEDGRPICEKIPVLDENGEKVRDKAGEVVMRDGPQRVHHEPVMEDQEVSKIIQQDTGATRLGLRYNELFAFVIGGIADEIDLQ